LFREDSVFRAHHFLQNLGTMRTLCDILKIPLELLEKTAKEFQGLEHRMELFVERNGIRFVDDSIAVNPTASIAAVQFFKNDLGSIVLGGRPSGDSWNELLRFLLDKTESIILLPNGESLHDILEMGERIGFPSERIFQAESFEEIVALAKRKTPQGKVCLLSPGAKSFDCFENYREKGDMFKRLAIE